MRKHAELKAIPAPRSSGRSMAVAALIRCLAVQLGWGFAVSMPFPSGPTTRESHAGLLGSPIRVDGSTQRGTAGAANGWLGEQ